METRANYIVVGLVTMAVLLASFGFIYWVARFGDKTDLVPLEIRIPGSVTGLTVGSEVKFNGINVGAVRGLEIDPVDPKVIIAFTEVKSNTPLTTGAEATLGFVGLTGQAYIELKAGNPKATNILSAAAQAGETARISADPGAVNNLIDRAQEIATAANRVVASLDQFMIDNQGALNDTVQNAAKFSKALGDNSGEIDDFLKSAGELSKTLQSVSGRLETTLVTAEDLLKSLDRKKLDAILTNVEKVSQDAATSSGEFKAIVESVKKSAENVSALSERAKTSLEQADKLIAAADPAKVKSVIDNLDETVKSAKTAASDIGKVTEKIGNRAAEIDQIVANTQELTARLNQTSVRVDGVLEKVSSFLGNTEGQGPGLVEEARKTLLAFQQVASNLNANITRIAGNLDKFSGRGLDGVGALVQDTRRSVSRIEQAITELEKNPNRLIFGGGGSVPKYDARPRR